jgi:hypothetical protein
VVAWRMHSENGLLMSLVLCRSPAVSIQVCRAAGREPKGGGSTPPVWVRQPCCTWQVAVRHEQWDMRKQSKMANPWFNT